MAEEVAHETKKPEKKAAQQSVADVPRVQGRWLVAGGFGVLALLFVSFAAGRMASLHDRDVRMTRVSVQRDAQVSAGSGYGMRGGWADTADVTENTRVSGVVTVVDGSTITVAGNGTTVKIEVSDNTTYRGSDAPAQVNDSITAVGAKNSSDVLVASAVVLSRE